MWKINEFVEFATLIVIKWAKVITKIHIIGGLPFRNWTTIIEKLDPQVLRELTLDDANETKIECI